MNAIVKFISGNSRVTPVGVAIAVALTLFLLHRTSWAAAAYVGALLFTLVISTFERV